jgi:hypothetical protein
LRLPRASEIAEVLRASNPEWAEVSAVVIRGDLRRIRKELACPQVYADPRLGHRSDRAQPLAIGQSSRPTAREIARRREAILAAWRSAGGGPIGLARLVKSVRASGPEWAGLPTSTINNDLAHFRRIGRIPRTIAPNRTRTAQDARYKQDTLARLGPPTPPRETPQGRSPGRWTAEDEATRAAMLVRLGEAAIWLAGGDPERKPEPGAVDRAAIAGWVREDRIRRGRRARRQHGRVAP